MNRDSTLRGDQSLCRWPGSRRSSPPQAISQQFPAEPVPEMRANRKNAPNPEATRNPKNSLLLFSGSPSSLSADLTLSNIARKETNFRSLRSQIPRLSPADSAELVYRIKWSFEEYFCHHALVFVRELMTVEERHAPDYRIGPPFRFRTER